MEIITGQKMLPVLQGLIFHPSRNPTFGEFHALPVVRRWNYRSRGTAIAGTGVFIAAVAAILVTQFRPFTSFSPALLITLVLLLGGIVVLLAGLHLSFVQGEIRIDLKQVTLFEANLFTRRQWISPLAEFQGVAVRTEIKKERTGPSDDVIYCKIYSVVMVHPDPGKNLWLYVSRNPARAYELWQLASRVLDLPAVGDPGRTLDPKLNLE